MTDRAIALVAALLAMTTVTSCSLKKSFPDKRYYVLEARRGAVEPRAEGGPVLRVRRFRVSPGLAEREFVYRTGELSYESDFYNEFLSAPSDLLTAITYRWLVDAGLFGSVLDQSSAVNHDLVLEGSVVRLVGDFRTPDAPLALLEVQFFVSRESVTGETILLDRSYQQGATFEAGSGADGLARAWSEALAQVLVSFERDLRESAAITGVERE